MRAQGGAVDAGASRQVRRAVVVGNGIAGLTAADTLRETGFDGELTIFGAEPHPAYSRPALSKALLHEGAGGASAREPDGVSRPTAHELPPPLHGATELLGTHATGLDPDRRTVTLDDGTTLPYDRLVLATGARARRLSALPGELTLRGLDDALFLRGRLAARPSLLVVGGGPLGMEIASGCLAAGCRVTLVSRGTPLHAHLGPYLAGRFTSAARELGLTVVETGTVGLEPDGTAAGGARAVLDDGTRLEAELLVSAVGYVPDTGWLAGTPLTADLTAEEAVRVDARGLVRPDIAAVGDLAAFPVACGTPGGARGAGRGAEPGAVPGSVPGAVRNGVPGAMPGGVRRVPLWSGAIEQAKTAARALLHGDAAQPLAYRPYFWTEQFGIGLRAAGPLPPPPGEPEYVDGEPGGGPALLRWPHPDGTATAVALDYRIPVPRLRRLSSGPA